MEYTNSKGTTYYLNATVTKNGNTLYFFSKDKRDSHIPMPVGREVSEGSRGLPVLKKKA